MNYDEGIFDVDKIQFLKCNNCEHSLKLVFSDISITRSNLHLDLDSCPNLYCEKCDKIHFDNLTKQLVLNLISKMLVNNVSTLKSKVNIDAYTKRFNYCPKLDFLYESLDYYFIPGLYRSLNEGYLTPVFFNKEVLLKYMYRNDYVMDFASNTYGSIYSTNEHVISFGINSSNKVIMWLGDINDLSIKEQYYLLSENIESDHDISSEFYESQINAEFTEVTDENKLLKVRFEFIEKCLKKYSLKISQYDLEVIAVIRSVIKPVVWNEHSMASIIQIFNKVINESININSLKKYMLQFDKNQDLKELGSLKLLEKWIHLFIDKLNASDVLSPLFVLYDLRVIYSHLIPNDKRREILLSCLKRLDLSAEYESDYEKIYQILLIKITDSFIELGKSL